jgi:hypothetical protein
VNHGYDLVVKDLNNVAVGFQPSLQVLFGGSRKELGAGSRSRKPAKNKWKGFGDPNFSVTPEA